MLQLAFEAIRGNGYRGDIALDEIKLVPGKCNASPGTLPPPVIKTPVKQKTTPEPPTRGEGKHGYSVITSPNDLPPHPVTYPPLPSPPPP